ncbi:MAG: dipeptide/oligopeptide/nickel ABC transporter ATP-binding protein [Steroidobacteraceae bacterium]
MSVVLEANAVSVSYTRGRGVHAVRDCSILICARETLALVGESGCGKSSLARAICGIVPIDAGSIRLHGRDLDNLPRAATRAARRRIQMVFQDPDASLNPRHRIGAILAEPLEVAGERNPARRVAELLDLVQLDSALAARLPRELSGGQKQRVAIARALAVEPDVLVADEPLASLDVATAAAMIALLRELQQRLSFAVLFISHDLAAVRQLADRVAVMFRGRIVECDATARVLDAPTNSYTKLLARAVLHPLAGKLDLNAAEALDREHALLHTTDT